MDTKRPQSGRGGKASLLITVLFLLGVGLPAYFLSIGPAVWLCFHGYLPSRAYQAYVVPARVVADRCRLIRRLMNDYARQFVPTAASF